MTSQGDLREALLLAAGEDPTVLNLDNEIGPLFISLTSGMLLDLLTQINAANGTRHYIRPADNRDDWYAYTTVNRQWKLGVGADIALDASDEHVTAIDGWRITADTVVNQQKATVDEPEFPIPPIKLWEWQGLPPLPLTIKSGAPLTFDATYSDYVLSCPDLVLTSSGDALTISFLHHGYSSTVTLASAGTTTVTALSIEGRQAVRDPSFTYSSDDTASQAFPRGIRAGAEISGDFVGPKAEARGIAQHMTWRYGDPSLRPSATVENWLPIALEHDLFDTVAFTSAQLRATGVVFEMVGITEEWRRAPTSPIAPHVITTYQWQQQKATVPLFRLDSSLLDGDPDVLAY